MNERVGNENVSDIFDDGEPAVTVFEPKQHRVRSALRRGGSALVVGGGLGYFTYKLGEHTLVNFLYPPDPDTPLAVSVENLVKGTLETTTAGLTTLTASLVPLLYKSRRNK